MRRREAITLQGRKSLVTVPHSLPPPPPPPPPPRAASWTHLSPATSPPPRYGHGFAWDKARGYGILYGGYDSVSSANPLYDTWKWDGVTWTELFPSTNPNTVFTPHNIPGEGFYGNLVWDDVNQKILMLLYTGDSVTPVFSFFCFHWSGTNWVQLSPAHLPVGVPGSASPLRFQRGWGASVSEAPGIGNVILFGGDNGVQYTLPGHEQMDETWSWTGTDFVQLFPATSPPKRSSAFQCYDSVANEVLLFGGGLGMTGLGQAFDTWGFDGTTWNAKTTTLTYLHGGYGKTMVYAPYRGQAIRIGGEILNDRDFTFLYDTVPHDWTGTNPSHPSDNQDASSQRLIWDPVRNLAVLFGGWESAFPHNTKNETWAYDPGTP